MCCLSKAILGCLASICHLSFKGQELCLLESIPEYTDICGMRGSLEKVSEWILTRESGQ